MNDYDVKRSLGQRYFKMSAYQEFMDLINQDVNEISIDILRSIERGCNSSKYTITTHRKAKILIVKELLIGKMFLDHNILTRITWKTDKKDNDKYIVEINYWKNVNDDNVE